MGTDLQVKLLCEALEAENWDVAANELKLFLDNAPYDCIGLLVDESTVSLRLWVVILIQTKLYSSNQKGEFFFKKVCLRIWALSTFENRWNLLKSILCLYSFDLKPIAAATSVEDVVMCIQDATSLPGQEILELFLYRDKVSNNNVAAVDQVVH